VNATGIAIADTKIAPDALGELLDLIDKGTINRNIAKTVFEEMFNTGKSAAQIVKEKGLEQVTDTGAIEAAVDAVIAANPKEGRAVQGWRGQAHQLLRRPGHARDEGEGESGMINELLKRKLGN